MAHHDRDARSGGGDGPRKPRGARGESVMPPPGPNRKRWDGEGTPESLGRGASFGRYVVLDRIGEGGVGEVYAAFDPELDRKVAVKLLRHRDGSGSASLQERLVREAQAMARVSHPNVIPIYDVGISSGRVFLTMEFVQGMTLRQWRREKHPSDHDLVAAYISAGRGLAAAHAAGLVH